MEETRRSSIATMREQFAQRARNLAGFEDISGIETAILIRAVANLFENLEMKYSTQLDMSGPRWGILMRLWDDEKNGSIGPTPSDISRFQQVKKNTISSMLRKLEEDDLIERKLDPTDKRRFHIRLTEKGKDLAERLSPKFAFFQNELASGLTSTEREELINLLTKLFESLMDRSPLKDIHTLKFKYHKSL
jgi:DNA-binding MarR family transcriptional regulator